ncbi:glycosyl hydrolase [Bacteroides sp. UBA939]|uniref:glycosyl hydrolase n=1 Tax=Bacteroides sp. UBA939 TaxID=1946092 RepID=UPI0025C720DC|nr:glycosyl hydrolase [Bacteroides sp. UBA939]
MKSIVFLFCFFLTGILFGACSDGGNEEAIVDEGKSAYALFLNKSITVSAGENQTDVVIDWAKTSWEITLGEGDIVKSITPTSGGNSDGEKQYAKIQVICNANATMKKRTQTIHLTDKTNQQTTDLLLEQEPAFRSVTLNVDPSIKYQPVVGFGGMYNPKIWLGNNLITAAEMAKMYGPGGLGYSILRLMIYPNESDWNADVEAARTAQANGAIVFACPWDCTNALSETIKVNGKDVKHLKKENYGAYAAHLIRYINFMKQNGVNLYAISVQNEPDMEFTYWTPQEVVDFVKQYGAGIRETGVKLMSPEACGTQPEYTDPIINDAVAFAQTDIVAGHLYQGFLDLNNGYVKNRHDYICGLYSRIQGKTWWMTEHLFNDGEKSEDPSQWEFQKWQYSLNHLGKEIHMSMEGYSSAYVYWYLKRFYGLMGDTDARCPVDEGEITKNGYIMAHYSQYATGATRIKAVTNNTGIYATAYLNETSDEVTVVLLNMTAATQFVEIPLAEVKSASAVETNENKNMEVVKVESLEEGNGVYVLLSGNSITSVRLRK